MLVLVHVCVAPPSAHVGHHCHRHCGAASAAVLLLLHLQEMLQAQEEEQGPEEGPQGCSGSGQCQDPGQLLQGKGQAATTRRCQHGGFAFSCDVLRTPGFEVLNK